MSGADVRSTKVAVNEYLREMNELWKAEDEFLKEMNEVLSAEDWGILQWMKGREK